MERISRTSSWTSSIRWFVSSIRRVRVVDPLVDVVEPVVHPAVGVVDLALQVVEPVVHAPVGLVDPQVDAGESVVDPCVGRAGPDAEGDDDRPHAEQQGQGVLVGHDVLLGA